MAREQEMRGPLVSADELPAMAGSFEGVSPWFEVTQERIDVFADATEDHQFIHVDPERAAATPFGGTIAHGFLTLSMLSAMAYATLPRAREAVMGINYGFERIRFLAPVRAGARIRARMKLVSCEERKPGELLSRYEVTVEIEGSDKPALAAEWLGMSIISRGNAA